MRRLQDPLSKLNNSSSGEHLCFLNMSSFLRAARCLCNFQHLLVEKFSLKGPIADELKILPKVLYCVPDAVECTERIY